MAVYNNIRIISLSMVLLLVVQKPTNGALTESNSQEIKLSEELLQRNFKESAVVEENDHTRVKRQFGFGYPYPYYGGFYRRPIPIIVGGIGFGGFGARGFGGRGFGGFGPRGFGGRGFGGRGFGGRGFGGRGFGGRGFGGRGFGGFGGRGIGGFGGRGIGGFGGRGGRG